MGKRLKRVLIYVFVPWRSSLFAIPAAEGGSRGMCYTVMALKFWFFPVGMGMMYEKNKDGSVNKELARIL